MKKKFISRLIFVILFLSSITAISQTNLVSSLIDNSYEPWYFVALGDSRNWSPNSTNLYRQTILEDVMVSNPKLDFILHSGDMVQEGGDQCDWDRYYEDIDLLVQNNVTFYYAVGNHETYTYDYENDTYGEPDMDFSTYMSNVEMLGNERYYSFDHKGIHFIVINTEEYWSDSSASKFDITTDQQEWIINDLESNTMNFTIAMFHRPLYSVRDTSRSHDADCVRNVLEPILIEYGVNLVFSGHDHYYYNTKRNGIQHVVTGGAGAPLANIRYSENAIDSDVYFSEYHYCNVSVTDEKITINTHVYDDSLESTTIQDIITINLNETSTEKTIFYFGYIIIIFGIIPFIRRKKQI